MKGKSLGCVQLFATPRTVARQAPPSMEFSKQEYWSGLAFPSPGERSSRPRDWSQVSRIAGTLYPLSHQGITVERYSLQMLFNPFRGFRYGSEKPCVIQHFILSGPADDTKDTFCEQNPLVKFVCLEHGDIILLLVPGDSELTGRWEALFALVSSCKIGVVLSRGGVGGSGVSGK